MPACDMLHRCGCRPFWNGGGEACDVHGSRGPHCPWCEHWPLGGLALLGVGAGQLLVFRARLRAGAALLPPLRPRASRRLPRCSR
jgi:hypothetical protein